MAKVTFFSDVLRDDFSGVKDIESLKKKVLEISLHNSIKFEHLDILVNDKNVYEHNTPLFDGDVVKAIPKPINAH